MSTYDNSVETIELPLQPEKGTFTKLKKAIIDQGFCSYCGVCGSVCPVDAIEMDGRQPILVGSCFGCGACLRSCPRYLMRKTEAKADESKPIGDYLEIVLAKSRLEDHDKTPAGAFLASMMQYGFREQVIDSANIIQQGDSITTNAPTLAFDEENAMSVVGDVSIRSPSMSVLDGIKKNSRSMPFIFGLPCQIHAARHIKETEKIFPAGVNAQLLLGLFCMECFDKETIVERLSKKDVDASDVKTMQIAGDKLVLTMNTGETQELPMKPFTKDSGVTPGCSYCFDLAAEHADLSFGVVDADHSDWVTVIVRNENGKLRLEQAEKLEYIEVKRESNEDELKHLLECGLKKKQKAATLPSLAADLAKKKKKK